MYQRESHQRIGSESTNRNSGWLLQRKCACGSSADLTGECKDCEKEKLLQKKSATDRQGPSSVPPIVNRVLASPGQALDAETRAFMETRFSHNFRDVRIHTDSLASASAHAVGAHAYTVGNDVAFATGQYQPRTAQGQQLIAHELTHVIQQKRGAASNSEIALGSAHDESEAEADRSAMLVAEGARPAIGSRSSGHLQRQPAGKVPPKPTGKTSPVKGKTPPVENCPLPSDFPDAHEAGMNMMCVAQASFEKNPRCNLTAKHFELLNKAKEPALKRVGKAESRMHWFGGPEYAERVARRIFKGEPPDKATIQQTLTKLVKILGGTSLQFRGATCADPLCESAEDRQHAVAYESGPTEPVAICVRSFLPDYLPKLARTIIHEAVHLAGIDIDPNVKERYCDGKGCEEQCDDTTNAEAWTLFIDCLGGPLIKPRTQPPAHKPRTSFDQKTIETVERDAPGLREILLDFGLREEKLDWQDEGSEVEPPFHGAFQSSDSGAATLAGEQTGGTNCDAAAGTPSSNVTNTNPCTKDCSARHEEKHAADIGPCCTKAGAAYKAAEKAEEKEAIQQKVQDWVKTNVNFLECRAYDVSVSCGEAKHKRLKCPDAPSNDKCCVPLVHYIRSARMQREATCNNAAKKLTDCPFP